MQLDKTHIAIRERGVTDILDLALHVMRAYFRPFFMTLFLGVVPFALLNEALVGWLIHMDLAADITTEDIVLRSLRYMWIMSLLVFVEAPAASIFATTWLGHAVFTDRPPMRTVWRNVVNVFPRFVWSILLLRGVIPVLLVAMAIRPNGSGEAEAFIMLPVGIVLLVRAIRPFMNEIVLLERNPLRSSNAETITIARRSVALHSSRGNSITYQAFVSGSYAILLSLILFGALPTVRGILVDRWTLDPRLIEFGWPLVLWLVVGFMTIVRFLNYLDLRIRDEGWEVELRMRAEGARIGAVLSEGGNRARTG